MKRKKKTDDKLPDLSKHQLVMTVWKDAQSCASWEEPAKIKEWAEKDYLVRNIGWKVCETKKYIVICSEITEDGDFGNKTKIPRGWVVKMQPVSLKFLKEV